MQSTLTIEKSVLKAISSTFCAQKKINPCSWKCIDCQGYKERMHLIQQRLLLTVVCCSSVIEEKRLRIFYLMNCEIHLSIAKEISLSQGQKKKNTMCMGWLLLRGRAIVPGWGKKDYDKSESVNLFYKLAPYLDTQWMTRPGVYFCTGLHWLAYVYKSGQNEVGRGIIRQFKCRYGGKGWELAVMMDKIPDFSYQV